MGRFWDGHQILIGIEDVEIFTLGEHGFLCRRRNGAGSAGKTVTEERVWVAGTVVSSVTGRSGERSGWDVLLTTILPMGNPLVISR